jgi:hypothetical protein
VSIDNDRQAGDEIEVTPEMVEAGMEEFYCHPILASEPERADVELALIATFRAMAKAKDCVADQREG